MMDWKVISAGQDDFNIHRICARNSLGPENVPIQEELTSFKISFIAKDGKIKSSRKLNKC